MTVYTDSNGNVYETLGAGVLQITKGDGTGEMQNFSSNCVSDLGIAETVTSVVIGEGITTIGQKSFKALGITSVSLSDSVTTIRTFAFSGCLSLTSVTIPDSVTSIESDAFYKCTSLESVTLGNGGLSLGQNAFEQCTSLTSIDIPSSIVSMSSGVFKNCTALESATIGFKWISLSTFSGCTALTSVTILDGVLEIEPLSFYQCTSLREITIPSSVESINGNVFGSIDNLLVTMINPVPCDLIGNSQFTTSSTIYVPASSVDAYKTAWSAWRDQIQPAPSPTTPSKDDMMMEIITGIPFGFL